MNGVYFKTEDGEYHELGPVEEITPETVGEDKEYIRTIGNEELTFTADMKMTKTAYQKLGVCFGAYDPVINKGCRQCDKSHECCIAKINARLSRRAF